MSGIKIKAEYIKRGKHGCTQSGWYVTIAGLFYVECFRTKSSALRWAKREAKTAQWISEYVTK